MRSDISTNRRIKYAPFFIGSILLLTVTVSYTFPENFKVDGESRPFSETEYLISGGLGFALIIYALFLNDKLIMVELTERLIRIINENEEIKWTDVESIRSVIFFYPVLYKLRVTDTESYYLFNTTNHTGGFLGFAVDSGEMGNLIKRKKDELSI